MQITLTQTGGFIPLTKKAETEVDWTEEEMEELISCCEASGGARTMRDATNYELTNDAGTFSIDLEKVPAKYKKTLDELKRKLKVVKF